MPVPSNSDIGFCDWGLELCQARQSHFPKHSAETQLRWERSCTSSNELGALRSLAAKGEASVTSTEAKRTETQSNLKC